MITRDWSTTGEAPDDVQTDIALNCSIDDDIAFGGSK